MAPASARCNGLRMPQSMWGPARRSQESAIITASFQIQFQAGEMHDTAHIAMNEHVDQSMASWVAEGGNDPKF